MRRTLTLISIFALLMGILALPAGGSTLPNSLEWDGQGSDSLRCDKLGESPERTEEGWIHWIVTQASGVTEAELELGGSGSGTYQPTKYGPVVEFFTPYFDVKTLTAFLHYAGTLDSDSQFVISDYCPGVARGEITITKTAVPSFTRTHKWDIDKSADTENEYELEDGTPKVWLYTDGSGDETATWTVDVTYEGYEDTGHALSGSVVIENTGNLDANITNLVDTYGGKEVIFDCTVNDTTFDFGQTLLEPEEVLACTYEVDPANEELFENTVRVGGTFSDGTTFNETDTATYDWDSPTTEVNATVNIKDISDLFGEVGLGTVTAPNGDQFTYTKDFAWEDYGQEECGSYTYDNTATIVETDQSASAALKVNVQCFIYESAWAKGGEDVAEVLPFCEAGFANWGWTNQILPGEYTMDLWAGAAQCDTTKGTLVGSVTVEYDEDGHVTAEFTVFEGYDLESTAFYADYAEFPTTPRGADTTAPGLYYNASPFNGSEIWTIAHANVGIPDPDFGP